MTLVLAEVVRNINSVVDDEQWAKKLICILGVFDSSILLTLALGLKPSDMVQMVAIEMLYNTKSLEAIRFPKILLNNERR